MGVGAPTFGGVAPMAGPGMYPPVAPVGGFGPGPVYSVAPYGGYPPY